MSSSLNAGHSRKKGSNVWAYIDGKADPVKVDQLTNVGVIVSDIGGDEVEEKLYPWHRVEFVTSNVQGEIRLEIG